ncbi:MAG TPA: ATP synthase F0 subunit B [Polyangiaceae bacterium]|nr:ATP synthase F0 subunit B [Polyangiaceae bacterium]
MLSASLDGVVLAASPQAINVDFDTTFVLQLVFFVLLTLALKPLVFDPTLKLFEARERLIDGVKSQARHIDERSASALAEYEKGMADARATGNAEREKTRQDGIRREQEILGGVRDATTRAVEDAKRQMYAEAERTRAALQIEVTTMAHTLATRVLGREVKS